MKNKWLCVSFSLVLFVQGALSQSEPLKMWYDEPADEWMKSLPIGNGRLSGMVFGGVSKETVALNEITLWSGQKNEAQEKPFGKEELRKLQQMFLDGKLEEGNAIASEKLVGSPASFGTHVPFGDIELLFGQGNTEVNNYSRSLDLNSGISSVSYEQGGVTYTREYFCSNPADVMVIRLTASQKGSQNFEICLNPLRESAITTEKDAICFTGQVSFPTFGPGGVNFYGQVKVLANGGSIRQNKESLSVENADEVLLIADLRTDYVPGNMHINTQQNYWAANVGNLQECNVPLFNYIESLVEAGAKTAATVYGCEGWVAHTMANVWGFTAPGWGTGWGLHPTGGAWLASHMWDYYRFTKDEVFLLRAYPVLKQTALFFLDYMIEDPDSGRLLTGPSTSPENSFKRNGKEMSLSMMPTCDRVIVYEILNACQHAAELLQVDDEFRGRIIDAIDRLPAFETGKYGQIQEWSEDFEEAVPNHRHTSHLLALYPYSQISVEQTPELAKAAAVSIDRRLNAPGWEDVEWSRANMINFYARLKEGQKAYESVLGLINELSRENMLTISPKGIAGAPTDIFVFDGNEAGAAGIAEMLLQSHEEYVELLPALPDAWGSGSYVGLCARGGFVVDLSWNNRAVKHVQVTATTDNTLKLRLPDRNGREKYYKNKKEIDPVTLPFGIVRIGLQKGDLFEVVYD